jgi:hypothetical protein
MTARNELLMQDPENRTDTYHSGGGEAIGAARDFCYAAPMGWGRFARIWTGRGWLWRACVIIFTLLVPAPIILLLIFRFVPIPGTPDMLRALVTGKACIIPGPATSPPGWNGR